MSNLISLWHVNEIKYIKKHFYLTYLKYKENQDVTLSHYKAQHFSYEGKTHTLFI
jgi:hypothetical protein